MATLLRLPRLVALLLVGVLLAEPAQPPVVDIDYSKYRKLWRAQREVLIAFEHLEAADEERGRTLGRHAETARQLLIEAAKEIKWASRGAAPDRSR